MNWFLRIKNEKGFTVVEMLVVSVIIFILYAMVIVNYRNYQPGLALERETYKLAAAIRKAQSMAGLNEESCTNADYKAGYGIHLDKNGNKYILFADCNGNNTFQQGTDQNLEEISLEKGVEIFNLTLIKKNSSQNKNKEEVDISFKPPDPYVFLGNNVKEVKIVLNLGEGSTKEKTITINKAGMIDID